MAEWCGLYAESSEEDFFLEGEELCKGDTIYLLGVEGTVCFDCGAWDGVLTTMCRGTN